MKRYVLLLTCLWCYTPFALAQQAGNCQLGSASDTLDVADVRAALFNNGGFFWRGSGNTYTVPKDGNANSMFTAGLWVGGLVDDGSHRFAGTRYGPWEFWPGPLDANGNPPDDCADHDRLYSVYDADIRAYERDGTLTDDLRDWPHHLGAHVVDGDGISGNYDLAAGDRPEIYGDQSVWWVMNDAGGEKGWSGTPPIGLEVQVQAFAAACLPGYSANPEVVALVNTAISQATYYRFTVIHKGQQPLRDVYIGWAPVIDIGNAADDFVGVDTTLHMAFQYNGLDFDADNAGRDGYGDRPPAIGLILAEEIDVAFDRRDNDGDGMIDEPDESLPINGYLLANGSSAPNGNPSGTTIEPYNFMRGIWRDGLPVTFGGTGYGGTTPTKYMFPGDPVTRSFWSEENTDGAGSSNTPGDRHDSVVSSGPFDFAPGDTTTFTLAIPWAQGVNRLHSITKLRQAAAIARGAVDALMQYDIRSCPAIETTDPEPEQPDPDALGFYILRQNYPEPFSQQTIIRYEVIDTVP
ncbi:MAG: hypothetical protein AAGJ10_21225, partial [Bacteroidota bacterium]